MPIAFLTDSALAAFGSSFTAITLAELGDKTFFMALILAARHRPRWVFIGAFAALVVVSLISLALGFGFRGLLPQMLLKWLAVVLFIGFGVKLLIDANGAEDQTNEAALAVAKAESNQKINSPWLVIWEAFLLVFIAELGDRTQIATIVLATAPGFGFQALLAGTLGGHAFVTWIAVSAGGWIKARINDKLLYQLSGVLFLLFAFAAIWF